ncbi:hypothetical protein T05_1460 [Trichinella murrelli]|uniref:Uncharacterized protein n=1 Tax=Trichinella murrelli TaxID=144512 RepID=A0A0V0TVZ7_9BILA|nr:hypothetical protein T05_1460 [Trichinella murrelli]
MQITIAITLPYHQFKEWSKENVKTQTTRSRTREGKSKVGEEGKKKEDQADETKSKQFPCHAATTGTDGEVEQ